MATTNDLTIRHGGTFARPLAIRQTNGGGFDLSNATVWLTIKEQTDWSADDDRALIRLYWVSGGASAGMDVADPALGVIDVTLTPEQTAALAINATYNYDVKIDKAGAIDFPIPCAAVTAVRTVTERVTTP
jgi:hypothetical protein